MSISGYMFCLAMDEDNVNLLWGEVVGSSLLIEDKEGDKRYYGYYFY